MKKHIYIATTAFAVLVVLLVFIAAQTPVDSSLKAARYVMGLGWSIDEAPIDTACVTLPDEFDNVYRQYNEIQKEAGFDLSEYMGKTVMRYTFAVKNFDGVEGVRANVLVYNGKIIGGDIMTVAIDGFMLPLTKR